MLCYIISHYLTLHHIHIHIHIILCLLRDRLQGPCNPSGRLGSVGRPQAGPHKILQAGFIIIIIIIVIIMIMIIVLIIIMIIIIMIIIIMNDSN